MGLSIMNEDLRSHTTVPSMRFDCSEAAVTSSSRRPGIIVEMSRPMERPGDVEMSWKSDLGSTSSV